MVTDSALLTLAHLGGIDPLQTCSELDEEQTEVQSFRRGAAEGWEKDSCSGSGLVSGSGSIIGCDRQQRENEGHVELTTGKKDAREDDSEEEEEEEGEVYRKEAVKVLCNLIYNSQRAQERAVSLRSFYIKRGFKISGLTSLSFKQ